MIVKRDRRSVNPRVEISIPSIVIFPPEIGIILKNANESVDFPAPVRP